jgi:UDP-galactose transporter
VSNLDAATFQVTYQLKILTTAFFSMSMLRRTISVKKWISLVLLMIGIAIVQIPVDEPEHKKLVRRTEAKDAHAGMDRSIGLMAVIAACAISGLAGVYFEKVLKDSKQVTLWVRNVQLSFYSLFPALFIGVIFKDGAGISRDGFFVGYNWVVVMAITFQALGGLLVALVVNYSDNIAKNFATSISIIISFFVSVWLFDFSITVNVSFIPPWRLIIHSHLIKFILGMAVVLYATFLYSSSDRRSPSVLLSQPSTPLNVRDEEKMYYDNDRITVRSEKPS